MTRAHPPSRRPAAPRPARRGLLAGALAAALTALLAACAGTGADADRSALDARPPAAPDGESLIVASDLDNMPFAGVDEQGRPTGRDVEMMEALAAELGRPIQWKRSAFETLLPAAQGGYVDVVCATMGITPERAEKVAFSRPYFETVIHVVVRAGEGEPRGWGDLHGRRVAAAAGTTSERAVRQVLPGAELVLENKEELGAAERLLLGDVDGVAMDGPAAERVVRRGSGALTLIEPPLASEHYALVLPPDRASLLRRLDAALARLERSGRLAELDRRWGLAR